MTTEEFKAPSKLHLAHLISVYDGDTFTSDIYLGYDIWLKDQKIRVFGIDTPEIRGGTLETKEAARKSRDRVRILLFGAKEIILGNITNDSFGRRVCRVWFDQKELSPLLIEEGFAIKYEKK